ncbi:hypothetical protein CHS0354_037267 [Potamilus streckersoni]|uniref:EGF-like domain-containing protein n=1 Tax=Potamilus streckersoni TaxID=2493646 RepID=A0AAE0SX97_9BIVA|nr:hypothetical protein CHS0354_037267 [Potamilus streckersoni]
MSSEDIKIQMSKSAMTVLLFVTVCHALFETALSAAPMPSSACDAWQHIAQNLSKPRRIYNVQCDNNPDDSNCAQLRCSGNYSMQLWFVKNEQNIPFCFGLYMNHCDSPVSMDYTLLIPGYNVSMAQHITHGSTVKVPGLSFSYLNIGSADVYLFFNLTKNSNSSSINFSITAKILLKVGFLSEWPSTLQKVLFPPTAIPVPPCNSTSTSNAPTRVPLTTCPSLHVNFTTQVPPATVSHPISEKVCDVGFMYGCGPYELCKEKEGLGGIFVCVCTDDAHWNRVNGLCELNQGSFGKGCELGLASNCGPNEICREKKGPGRNGICLCQDGFHQNLENNLCEVNTQIINAVTTASKQGQKASSGFQMTPLIIGAIVGGLVVIVAIIGVIIFLGRRRRLARYQNRQLLLSNEDDEEDDDANVNI